MSIAYGKEICHAAFAYIGDAIELGYTIKTTGADDSIVHIVQ